MEPLEFRVLGALEVLAAGEPLSLGGAKQRAVLAVLLLQANEIVPTERLIDQLWGESPPATAAHTIQVYVSNLRKVLSTERLETRAPGYRLRVRPDELDLERFERLLAAARESLASAPERASEQLGEALSLWRGTPLADFRYEAFAQPAIARLEELRLAALEDRLEADLAAGRHGELVAELRALVDEHPLRERARGQLMLALYRAGRQAEALELFQQTRRLLVEELGIEPSVRLQELERAILRQDADLAAPGPGERWLEEPVRSILLAATHAGDLDRLVSFAEPLALAPPPHELVLALALPAEARLDEGAGELNERRTELAARAVVARAAAFTSAEPARDIVRLASEQDVDLVLLHGDAEALGEPALAVCRDAPCDVGLVFDRGPRGGPVLVPFGGGEHDWAALELAAWCAGAVDVPLTLLGARTGARNASRLLAHAALAVQQLTGVVTQPALAPGGDEGVLEAARAAGLLVIGFPDDWRRLGLGATRSTLARDAGPTTIAVRRGLRPGGLAPGGTLTQFTWSLADVYVDAARQSDNA